MLSPPFVFQQRGRGYLAVFLPFSTYRGRLITHRVCECHLTVADYGCQSPVVPPKERSGRVAEL